jgi:hypothetical protein
MNLLNRHRFAEPFGRVGHGPRARSFPACRLPLYSYRLRFSNLRLLRETSRRTPSVRRRSAARTGLSSRTGLF